MSIPDGWQMPRSNGRLDYSLVLARRENGQPPTAHHTTSNSHAAPAEPPDETPTASARRGAPLTLTERAAIIDGYTRRREESPTLSRTAIVNLMCEEGEVVATRFGCSIAYVEKVVQAALKARKA